MAVAHVACGGAVVSGVCWWLWLWWCVLVVVVLGLVVCAGGFGVVVELGHGWLVTGLGYDGGVVI